MEIINKYNKLLPKKILQEVKENLPKDISNDKIKKIMD